MAGSNGRRRVDYLRLSITDRCNLRCTYCMPPEGVPARRHDEILSFEELVEFARAAVGCGVRKVRITGGEPLARHGCVEFVAMLADVEGIRDLSLTTNGVLLPRFAPALRAAGLRRVNVSIDSLTQERYATITRGGRLAAALAGLEAAFAAGFDPVKLNVLLLEGVEHELDDFVALTLDRPLHVRFIEFMPLDRRLVVDGAMVPAPLVLERLRARHALVPVDGPYGHGPARYWAVPGAPGTLGFIAGVSDHFCETCNRLRLTADGRLRTCLFSGRETEVRPLIGDRDALRAALLEALSGKSYDRCVETHENERAMSQIGG
jgi:cyclic pyranopterin phosphate synthase